MSLLTDTLEEDWQVVMVVELVDFDFPCNLNGGGVLNGNGQISTVIESTELSWLNLSGINGTGLRLLGLRLLDSLVG